MDWVSQVRARMHDRVWVDFNSGFDRTESEGIHFRQPDLGTIGSKRDVKRLRVELREGLPLQVFMEDLGVDGRPGALVASGSVICGPFGWLVEIADDNVEWIACD